LDMEYSTLVGLSGYPVVEGGFVGPVGSSWPEQDVESLSGSARIQAQDHSPDPTHTKMPRQSHNREPAEQDRSTATATHDSRHPKNDGGTADLVAFAHRYPQIPHARATVLRVCTCARLVVAIVGLPTDGVGFVMRCEGSGVG